MAKKKASPPPTTLSIIREGDRAFHCDGDHLKLSYWTYRAPGVQLLPPGGDDPYTTVPIGRKFTTLRLYPDPNWKYFERGGKAWLARQGITLQAGECVLCPRDLTLEDLIGKRSPDPYRD